MLALAVACAPATAVAQRLAIDEVAGTPLSRGEVSTAQAPDIDAAAGLVATSDGRVLWSRAAEARRAMGSTTKMMTAHLALKAGDLDKVATVSKAAAGVDYAVGLKAGEKVTRRKLLELAVVASSNDAAYALGEAVGGSMPEFVRMMNAEAAELGLKDTHYVNPHGLDERGHYTSARDLLTLARVVMADPEYRRLALQRSAKLPYRQGRYQKLQATNELLGSYTGVDGVKTGYTDDAGFCFVASAQRDEVWLVSVILGTPDNKARFDQTRRLLDWGFAHVRPEPVASPGEDVGAVLVSGHPERSVKVGFESTVTAPVFDLEPELTRHVALPKDMPLPVFQGQPIGEVTWMQGDSIVCTEPAVATAGMASVGEEVGQVPVTDYLDRTVVATAMESSDVPVFDTSVPIDRRIVLRGDVKAPVSKGDRLGEIVYEQGGRVVMRLPVVAATTAEVPNAFQRMGIWFVRGWRSVFGGQAMASPVVATP